MDQQLGTVLPTPQMRRPDAPMIPPSQAKDAPSSTGLTSDEARHRLEKFGPNTIPDTALHPLRRALTKFWAPVPWMLEAAVVLELALGKYGEASIIAGLWRSTPCSDSSRKAAPRRRLPR